MRCYQHIGLKQKAIEWLQENVVKVPTMECPECGHKMGEKLKVEQTERVDMFYGDGPVLSTYSLNSGGLVKEIVQKAPWSSGPMGFLCLELEGGAKLFKWTSEEIEEYL